MILNIIKDKFIMFKNCFIDSNCIFFTETKLVNFLNNCTHLLGTCHVEGVTGYIKRGRKRHDCGHHIEGYCWFFKNIYIWILV